jgi:hypothetical protein
MLGVRSQAAIHRRKLQVKYFKGLNQIVESLETDESTNNDPIKIAFVFDEKYLTANV